LWCDIGGGGSSSRRRRSIGMAYQENERGSSADSVRFGPSYSQRERERERETRADLKLGASIIFYFSIVSALVVMDLTSMLP
jgi:hypothetical protein